MEELLKEVALSERRKQQIDSFIQTVTELLQAVPDSPEVEVQQRLGFILQIPTLKAITTSLTPSLSPCSG